MKVFLRLFTCALVTLSCFGCMQRYYNAATQQEEVYFYSTEKEVGIGNSLSKVIEEKFKLKEDPLEQKRLQHIGEKIVQVCDRQEIKYHFALLDEKEVNAFALPGGYIYVFEGLWKKIKDSDDEVAAVLAHELAHITTRHSIKRLQGSLGYSVVAVLVGTTPSMDAQSKRNALSGINELMLSYSRDDELQADSLSVRYLALSGYNPQAILAVLDLLQETERDKPVRSAYLATHPYLTERMRRVTELINRGTIRFDDYI
ncbi:MAG: M48 family metalloprotease, partial [Candidatus Omnitrophota bacterium]